MINNQGTNVSIIVPPAPSDKYEVRMRLDYTKVWQYLPPESMSALLVRARTDTDLNNQLGMAYSVQFRNARFVNGACTAALEIHQHDWEIEQILAGTMVSCSVQTEVRAVLTYNNYLAVFVNGRQYLGLTLQAPYPTNYDVWPGFKGIPTSESGVDLGGFDGVAPGPASGITATAYPYRVDLQWQPAADDANGSGIGGYYVYRDGVYLGHTGLTSWTDSGVTPGKNYTYTIHAMDFFLNWSGPATHAVRTPSVGGGSTGPDARRVGVRSNGSYWGAAGEQTDVLSGNLNYTLPLLKAIGRGNWGVDFALSYNSQVWRKDSGVTTNLGRDIGYGFGWQLMAGSLTPVWADAYTFGYYLFRDSTGAEYKLDTPSPGGIWTSREGIYVEYDELNQRLWFPDGSFWKFGSVSPGTEQDGGTRYPTLMQDSNGNQVIVRYKPGLGMTLADTSGRIHEIEDVRGKGSAVYRFTYNTDATPHLTAIDSLYSGGPRYTFSYLAGQALYSPFSPPQAFGTTTLLRQVTQTKLSETHWFEYDAAGSGELTQVTLPRGGRLRWAYREFTYAGDRKLREVQYRYLMKAAGAAEDTYYFQHDDGASIPNHQWTVLHDPGGTGKAWFFDTSGLGVLLWREDRIGPHWGTLLHEDYSYTSGRRPVSSTSGPGDRRG